MRDYLWIMRPVSPLAPAETSARARGDNPHERIGCQLPGIHIEPNQHGDCVNFSSLNSSLNDGGFNLVMDGSCDFPVGGDPLLGPLHNNGGPTRTHAPLSGSPAINGITDPAACDVSTDQRGIPRPQPAGGRCDIGAVEQWEPCDCSAPHARRGTAGPDVLVGTEDDDILCGLGGDDVLIGRGGLPQWRPRK